jgi:hypothetical protein
VLLEAQPKQYGMVQLQQVHAQQASLERNGKKKL